MKPETDWREIERRWCAGESARALAKVFGVTHTAINKREKLRVGRKLPIREFDQIANSRIELKPNCEFAVFIRSKIAVGIRLLNTPSECLCIFIKLSSDGRFRGALRMVSTPKNCEFRANGMLRNAKVAC